MRPYTRLPSIRFAGPSKPLERLAHRGKLLHYFGKAFTIFGIDQIRSYLETVVACWTENQIVEKMTIVRIRESNLSFQRPSPTRLAMPPRTGIGMPNTSQFLFVNQDAASVLTKANDRQLNQSKQSHVQRHHFARKRRAQSRGLHELAHVDLDDLNGGILSDHQPSNSRLTLSSPGQPPFTAERHADDAQYDLPGYTANADSLHEASPEIAELNQHYIANSEVPRPRQGYALDPFSTTTLILHPAAPSLIHYYTSAMIPRIFAVDARAANTSGHRHLHAFQKDMQGCLTDETQMYALLASSMVHKNRFENQVRIPGIKADDEERAPLYFKMRAMAAVRRKLADGDLDLGLFQVVYRLMATERCLENHEAAKTHFRALFALVNALGGVHSLDSYNKERIIHSDLFEAAQSLRSPDLPLTWDPGHLPASILLKIAPPESLEALGSGFLDSRYSKIFHIHMFDIFSALSTVIHLTVYSWTPTADLTEDDLSWQTLRRAAIEHRLLSFPSTHSDAGDHNFIQECTRVATLFWVALYLADPVRKMIMAPFNFLLRQTLERSGLQSLWYPHSALLFWIVTTGAFIAKEGDEYDWFATMAAKVATYLELKKEADVKRVLQEFFYIDTVQHTVLAKLVGEFDHYLRLSHTQVRYYDLDSSPQGCSIDPFRDSP